MLDEILKTAKSIPALDNDYLSRTRRHLDSLTKPQGSLGRLEKIASQYVSIREDPQPCIVKKRAVVFAGDHGVAAEGVSAYPAEVTPQMVLNFVNGGAAINVLARHAGADIKIVDIGVNHDFGDLQGLIQRKVRRGTRNFVQGPALTAEETAMALNTGLDLAAEARSNGIDLLATGEMGIGNTTASSAIAAVLLRCDVKAITGRGTGLDDAGINYKIGVIQKGLAANRNNLATPLEVLAAFGGLEIAGMCGLIIGAAKSRLPLIVDGFIATCAALIAIKLNPSIQDYLFFGHCSHEKGHTKVLQALDASPILNLEMRLGEGTGAVLAMNIIEAAVRLYSEMATFEQAQVSQKSNS